MTENELDRLALLLAEAQGRTLDVATMRIWWDALHDLDGDLAYDALRRLIRETSDYITPAMLRRTAAQIASERLDAAIIPSPPSDLSAIQYLRWLRAWRASITAGRASQFAEQEALDAVGMSTTTVRDRPVPAVALPALARDDPSDSGDAED